MGANTIAVHMYTKTTLSIKVDSIQSLQGLIWVTCDISHNTDSINFRSLCDGMLISIF